MKETHTAPTRKKYCRLNGFLGVKREIIRLVDYRFETRVESQVCFRFSTSSVGPSGDGELVRSGTSDTDGGRGGRDSPKRCRRAEEMLLRRFGERPSSEGAGRAVGEREEVTKRRAGERQEQRTGGV